MVHGILGHGDPGGCRGSQGFRKSWGLRGQAFPSKNDNINENYKQNKKLRNALKKQFYVFAVQQQGGTSDRSSSPEVFLGKGVLKICRKFKGEHP